MSKKGYLTPEGVEDYIQKFKRDATRTLRELGLPLEEEKRKLEVLETNVDRLKKLLLVQIPLNPPLDQVEVEENDDSYEPEFSLFPVQSPKEDGRGEEAKGT